MLYTDRVNPPFVGRFGWVTKYAGVLAPGYCAFTATGTEFYLVYIREWGWTLVAAACAVANVLSATAATSLRKAYLYQREISNAYRQEIIQSRKAHLTQIIFGVADGDDLGNEN